MAITLGPGEAKELSVQMVPLHVEPEKAMVFGVVTDAETGQGIAGASIHLQNGGGAYSTQTAIDGTYQIDNIEPGTYTMVVTHDDYEDVVI